MSSSSREVPGDLAVVREFVNTRDADDDSDAIADPDTLRAWLGDAGLLGAAEPVSVADVALAQNVREALRELLLVNNHGGDPAPGTLATLGSASRDAGLWLAFDETGEPRLEPAAAGVAGALGRLLAIVYGARLQGTWTRLKACREDTCQWAFYDHSKNRSGHWCSMDVCGSRNKARAYRRRRKETEAAGDGAVP
jgi:predicted RNA-binding Zn ribbon-like protein